MPVSIVVGGQFGSEGKGKVAQYLVATRDARAAVRVGGSNSGHTTMAPDGSRLVLRHLPTAAVLPGVCCVLPAGTYLDAEVLLREIREVDIAPDRLAIDPFAMLILAEDRDIEARSGLGNEIGSTCSGTGAAVIRRIQRNGTATFARDHPELRTFVRPASEVLGRLLDAGERVVVEGTQGFGLSLLHSPHYPHATARDVTAAAALSEVGLSPFDVDEIVLAVRAFPIRVAGTSGPFGAPELSWGTVAREGGHRRDLSEFTSVTGKLRRVARFDPQIVRAAIRANRPTSVVLNHADYVDAAALNGVLTSRVKDFVSGVSDSIGRRIDLIGLGPDLLVKAVD